MTNPYFDEKGNRIIIPSFCLYFDILGFSKNIKETFEKGNRDYSYFNNYIKILKEELEHIEKFSFNNLSIKVFTDNFVIGYPWYDDGEAELGNLISIISHIQYSFITNDLLIRGAIALSDLHMDDVIVIGPALIEAYELESKIAYYPRIILSDSVVKVVEKYIGYYGDKSNSPQNHYFLVDKDNKVFINYLSIGKQYFYKGIELTDFLIKHKESILRNSFNITGDNNILQKYIWLAEYHNYFVEDNFYMDNDETKDLLIDLSQISKGIKHIVN